MSTIALLITEVSVSLRPGPKLTWVLPAAKAVSPAGGGEDWTMMDKVSSLNEALKIPSILIQSLAYDK